MFLSPYTIFWLALGFLLGITFLALINGWRKPSRTSKKFHIPNNPIQNAKLFATLATLIAIAIISWFIKYYAINQNWDPIIGEISSTIFQVATAGLLGGIVFELFLRKDILAETSEVLAEVVTTDKKVVKELFTKEKRNKMIELMIQLNSKNEVYGSALYNDFISRYTDETLGYKKEFRFDFEDSITFSDIDPENFPELSKDYFEVVDKVHFQTYLSEYIGNDEFIFGTAENEMGLYKYFNDPKCLFRWLLKTDKFKDILLNNNFNVNFSIDSEECKPMEGKFTERGFEIHFPNPLLKERISENSFKERIIELEYEIRTLHPKVMTFVSVHLAYPVKGAEINFDFEKAKSIRNVTWLHFLTAGKLTPHIEEGVSFHLGKSKLQGRRKVKISNDHWLFPDSGVVFIWENTQE